VESRYTLGSYRLIAELGHGGMADVYLAAVEGPSGAGFTKLAVVKKLREHLAEDPEFVSMLMDEARLTSRLSHPNVVQLFEMCCVENQYFLAIEYLEGKPLHRLARRVQRTGAEFPPAIYYAIVSDVLAGLHYAHELADYDGTPLEVVHRDVSPHNIFVTYDGTVKVVDFGIAKAIGRTTHTQQGIVKGKVRYMSPEQAAGGVVDRRTDVFAVGVVLWNAVTGAKLWADLDDVQVAHALRSGEYPTSPREVRPDVPPEIDAICRKALAFRREDRYPTAAAMRLDVEAVLGLASAQARTQLATTMKELFESDRAKLREVLEAARLTSVACLDTFTAATHNKSMPRLARPRRRANGPEQPRVAKSSRSRGSATPSGVPASRPKVAVEAKSSTMHRQRSAMRMIATVASALAAAAIAVAYAFEVSDRAAVTSAPRQIATVVSDLTTPAGHDGDRKVVRPPNGNADNRTLRGGAVPRKADVPSPVASPNASQFVDSDGGGPRTLDRSDPWGPVTAPSAPR
jgi:serine/threonine protein kinase